MGSAVGSFSKCSVAQNMVSFCLPLQMWAPGDPPARLLSRKNSGLRAKIDLSKGRQTVHASSQLYLHDPRQWELDRALPDRGQVHRRVHPAPQKALAMRRQLAAASQAPLMNG